MLERRYSNSQEERIDRVPKPALETLSCCAVESGMGLGCGKTQRRANLGEKHFSRCPFRASEEHSELRSGHLRIGFSAVCKISRFHTARVISGPHAAKAAGPLLPQLRTLIRATPMLQGCNGRSRSGSQQSSQRTPTRPSLLVR